MTEWFEKIVERTERVEWRVRVPAGGLPAERVVKVVNLAIEERQHDLLAGRKPTDVVVRVRSTINGSPEELVTVAYQRTVYGRSYCDPPERDDEE